MISAGQQEKLTIYTYPTGDDMENGKSRQEDTYKVQVNPKDVKKNIQVNHVQDDNLGNYAKNFQFHNVSPQKVSLEFLIDGTGAVPMDKDNPGALVPFSEKGKNPDFVKKEVDHLEKIMTKYEGENHRVPFVGLNWRGEFFKGLLEKMDISYTLFDKSGLPLQANVSIDIVEYHSLKRQVEVNGESSPDLTHVRVVQQGDNIMTLSREIYGDPKYYLQVAQANGLANFMKLKTGTTLVFPPFEKNTSQ